MVRVTKIKAADFKTGNVRSLVAFAGNDFSVAVELSEKRSYYVVTLSFKGFLLGAWSKTLKGIEAANKRVSELTELSLTDDFCKQISKGFERENSNLNQTDRGLGCKQKSNRGGVRPGAGRKKKQPTKLMRVPVRFEQHIRSYIAELENAEKTLAKK